MTKANAAPGDPACAKTMPSRSKRTHRTSVETDLDGRIDAKGDQTNAPLPKHWRVYFLAALADTSNVTAACAASGASPSHAYKVRREDANFARAWRDALFEGYENLEMETLHRLRTGVTDRKYDIANSIRLLAAHRATIATERARRDNQDEQQVLDSIDKMLDEMRERSAANAALLAEDGDGED